MTEEINLASPSDIDAHKALWLIEHPTREPSTSKQWNKKWQYSNQRNQELRRIASDYQESEKRRKEIRGTRGPNRILTLQEKQEENERWERIFKERVEDKNYYGPRPLPRKSVWG